MTHKLSEVTEGASHASFGVPAILKRRFSEHVCDKPSDSRGVAQGVCDATSNPDGDGTSGESWVEDAGYQGTNAIASCQTQ